MFEFLELSWCALVHHDRYKLSSRGKTLNSFAKLVSFLQNLQIKRLLIGSDVS